jgi:hypothetical protein
MSYQFSKYDTDIGREKPNDGHLISAFLQTSGCLIDGSLKYVSCGNYSARNLSILHKYPITKDGVRVTFETPQVVRPILTKAQGSQLCYISKGHRVRLFGEELVIEGAKCKPHGSEMAYFRTHGGEEKTYYVSDGILVETLPVESVCAGIDGPTVQYTPNVEYTMPWNFQHLSEFRPNIGETIILLIKGVEYELATGVYDVIINTKGITSRDGHYVDDFLPLLPGVYTHNKGQYKRTNKDATGADYYDYIRDQQCGFSVDEFSLILEIHNFSCIVGFEESVAFCSADPSVSLSLSTLCGHSTPCGSASDVVFFDEALTNYEVERRLLLSFNTVDWSAIRRLSRSTGGYFDDDVFTFGKVSCQYSPKLNPCVVEFKRMHIGALSLDAPIHAKLTEEIEEVMENPTRDEIGDLSSCIMLRFLQEQRQHGDYFAYTSIMSKYFPDTFKKYSSRCNDMVFRSSRIPIPRLYLKGCYTHSRGKKTYARIAGYHSHVGVIHEGAHIFKVGNASDREPDFEFDERGIVYELFHVGIIERSLVTSSKPCPGKNFYCAQMIKDIFNETAIGDGDGYKWSRGYLQEEDHVIRGFVVRDVKEDVKFSGPSRYAELRSFLLLHFFKNTSPYFVFYSNDCVTEVKIINSRVLVDPDIGDIMKSYSDVKNYVDDET